MRMILTICALLMPGGLLADTVFEPPRRCTKILTVQQRECQVMNVWECDGGAEGWAGYFGDEGAVMSFEKYGPDGEFIHIQDFEIGGLMMTAKSAKDNSSMSSLIETGTDTIDMTVSLRVLVLEVELRAVGKSARTGEVIVVDGEQLKVLRTSVSMMVKENDITGLDMNISGTSKDYLLLSDQIMIDGEGILQTPEGEERYNHTPIEIIRPGEDGFFSRIPKYDCGAQVSSLIKTTPRAFDDEDRL
ncbi:hypothetical protein [Halovulum sp. GXIMD14793]